MRLYEILEARSNVPVDDAFAVLFAGKHKTSEISGVPPVSFTSKGGVLEDYRISGNTVQDGTPSPEAPVDVVGCGAWDEANQSFKLPLTVNGTERPIYLGQVETTRRIKKFVLTGDERWKYSEVTNTARCYLGAAVSGGDGVGGCLCTHYVPTGYNVAYPNSGKMAINSAGSVIFNVPVGSSETDFKSFLASEYSAGHPVTIWYVLATQETAIVNEPLQKIGDYADTISMAQASVTIPTIAGTNTLTIDTAVQPSSVTIRGRIRPTL